MIYGLGRAFLIESSIKGEVALPVLYTFQLIKCQNLQNQEQIKRVMQSTGFSIYQQKTMKGFQKRYFSGPVFISYMLPMV